MISGERFAAVYRIVGEQVDAYSKAVDICYEQTVEFPHELVPAGMIRDHVVGRIESFAKAGDGVWQAEISYAVETAAGELTQFLNVLFGNISIKPGIRLERISLPQGMLAGFRGPRFGREGLRELLGIRERPILFTALKPMGLSARELAEMAYKCALGGIDIIKDDHGLTDQIFAPFEERVALCAEAVEKANRETGERSIYVPNVTAPGGLVMERAKRAKELGAGGLLFSPAISGWDEMRRLADDDGLALPVFSHPAFAGSFVTCGDNGISHYALFGQMNRLAGADAVIYPNFGGRFSFSREECGQIVRGTETDMGNIKRIFPSPGGGISLGRIEELMAVYGRDVIFLVGGGLFTHGPDLVENCRHFRQIVSLGSGLMY